MEYIYNWINNNTRLVISITEGDFKYLDIISISNINIYGNTIELINNNMSIVINTDHLLITEAGGIYSNNGLTVELIPVDNDMEF